MDWWRLASASLQPWGSSGLDEGLCWGAVEMPLGPEERPGAMREILDGQAGSTCMIMYVHDCIYL